VGNNDSSVPKQDPAPVITVDLNPLIETSRFLENKFGYPLDIEWAYSMGEFHILQVRPITNLPPPDRRGNRTYSRVQAEQFYSGPVTPLFYSIFKKIFTEYYLKESIDTLGLNIEVDSEYMVRHRNFLFVDTRIVKYALSTIPDRIEIKDFLEVLPPDSREYLKEDKNGSLFSILGRVLTFILFHRKLWISKLDSTFKNETVPEILSRLNSLEDLRTLNDDQLIDHYHRLMEVMKLHVDISKWGLSLYSIPLMGALDHLLKRNDLAVYLPDLISGFTENRTMEASKEIRHLGAMAKNNKRIRNVLASDLGDHSEYLSRIKRIPNGDRFIEYFENVIRMYGHRRISRDIYYPSWGDDANIPFSILRKLALSSSDQDFDRNLEQIRCKRITAIGNVRSSLSRSEKFLFSIIYKHLLRYVEFRELQRFYLDMILAKFRELVLEISSRMVDRETVWIVSRISSSSILDRFGKF
jgi:pyruvate,water dikinase